MAHLVEKEGNYLRKEQINGVPYRPIMNERKDYIPVNLIIGQTLDLLLFVCVVVLSFVNLDHYISNYAYA